MQSLTKLNGIYYFRLRVPKNLMQWFPSPTLKKSLQTKKYGYAKSQARHLLGEAERVFALIRSKTLDADAVRKIIAEFMGACLELKYDAPSEVISAPEMEDTMREIYHGAQNEALNAVKRRRDTFLSHLPLSGISAEYLCQKAGYGTDVSSPEYKRLVHELAIAKRDIIATLQERLETGDSVHDKVQRAQQAKAKEERSKSNTLSELIQSYAEVKSNVTGRNRNTKVPEKMGKFLECFQYETGKKDILLADIDYQLTVRVGKRLALYPSYRHTRYKGKSLDEIYKLDNLRYPSVSTVNEELYRLSGLFDFALTKLEGLKKNYAKNLGEVITGRVKSKDSDARDIFRPDDIQEIIRGLRAFRDKGYFAKNAHLPFITLIGLYSGARINEICQLKVDDLQEVEGIWCFCHSENSQGKSLKNKNSFRTNPIHPTLLDFGLLRFRDSQVEKGYSGLWEGVERHSCEFNAKAGNCSKFVGKWWNDTFKAKLSLSNPEKQTFHSTRHTFINWFRQNVKLLDYDARNALSGHLDQDDAAALRFQGYDPDSEGEKTYSKGLNVDRQLKLLQQLDYGIDLRPLRII